MNRNSLSAAIAVTLLVAAGAALAQDAQNAGTTGTQPQRSNVASSSNTTNDNATRRATQQMSAVQVKANSLALGGGLMSIQDAPKAVSTVSRDAIVKAAPGATFVQAINSIPGVVSSTDDYTGLNDGNASVRGFPLDEVGVTVNGAPINDSGNYKIYSSEYGDTENMGDITVQQGYPDNDSPIAGAAGGSIAWVTVDPSHKAGLDFSQSQGHLRKYLEEVYGKVFRRYMQLVNEAAPRLPPIELFWRVHFMLGAAAFSMSGIKALRAMAENDFGVNTSIEQVMRLMVPFLAAGMRADSGVSDPSLAGAQPKPRSKAPAPAKV